MNSLILCEGKTDCILLQYYMEKVNSWTRIGKSPFHAVNNSRSDSYSKDDNTLIISETKGCSRIAEGLVTAIQRNENAAPGDESEYFDKIIIFTDNDEEDTPGDMLAIIQNELQATSASFAKQINKNMWNKGTVQSIAGSRDFELYIMFIPFEENGALETYLLSCIQNDNSYDKCIIDKGNMFVDSVDPEVRYLKQRRLKTKAKFDVYFSVRTAATQFTERQDILRSIAWEKYASIRIDFKVFEDLG